MVHNKSIKYSEKINFLLSYLFNVHVDLILLLLWGLRTKEVKPRVKKITKTGTKTKIYDVEQMRQLYKPKEITFPWTNEFHCLINSDFIGGRFVCFFAFRFMHSYLCHTRFATVDKKLINCRQQSFLHTTQLLWISFHFREVFGYISCFSLSVCCR